MRTSYLHDVRSLVPRLNTYLPGMPSLAGRDRLELGAGDAVAHLGQRHRGHCAGLGRTARIRQRELERDRAAELEDAGTVGVDRRLQPRPRVAHVVGDDTFRYIAGDVARADAVRVRAHHAR